MGKNKKPILVCRFPHFENHLEIERTKKTLSNLEKDYYIIVVEEPINKSEFQLLGDTSIFKFLTTWLLRKIIKQKN